jgi:hypothetical protein
VADKQKSEFLPVGYLVFTLPHELNALILTNKKMLLSHLFKAVGKTLVDFQSQADSGLPNQLITVAFRRVNHTFLYLYPRDR